MEGENCGVSDPVPVGYTIYGYTNGCPHALPISLIFPTYMVAYTRLSGCISLTHSKLIQVSASQVLLFCMACMHGQAKYDIEVRRSYMHKCKALICMNVCMHN